jgi:hypothetical protein
VELPCERRGGCARARPRARPWRPAGSEQRYREVTKACRGGDGGAGTRNGGEAAVGAAAQGLPLLLGLSAGGAWASFRALSRG